MLKIKEQAIQLSRSCDRDLRSDDTTYL